MEKIKLNDILKLKTLDNVKIRFNLSNNSWNALSLYHENPNELLIGNFHNSTKKRWFKKNEIVIGLAQVKNDEWLLIDISKIIESYNNLHDGKTKANIHTFYEHEILLMR